MWIWLRTHSRGENLQGSTPTPGGTAWIDAYTCPLSPHQGMSPASSGRSKERRRSALVPGVSPQKPPGIIEVAGPRQALASEQTPPWAER